MAADAAAGGGRSARLSALQAQEQEQLAEAAAAGEAAGAARKQVRSALRILMMMTVALHPMEVALPGLGHGNHEGSR